MRERCTEEQAVEIMEVVFGERGKTEVTPIALITAAINEDADAGDLVVDGGWAERDVDRMMGAWAAYQTLDPIDKPEAWFVAETGGNCRAFQRDLAGDTDTLESSYRYAMITDPYDAQLPGSAESVQLGIYNSDSGDCIASYETMTLDEAVAIVGRIEGGTAPNEIVGAIVQLARDVDRFPHFVATKGSVGRVVAVEGDIRVHMDTPIDGCEEWDHCVIWFEDLRGDFASDICGGL